MFFYFMLVQDSKIVLDSQQIPNLCYGIIKHRNNEKIVKNRRNKNNEWKYDFVIPNFKIIMVN